jgi:hypothetical protein
MKKIAIIALIALWSGLVAIVSYKFGMRHVTDDSRIYLENQEDGVHVLIDIDGNLYEHIAE